MLRELPPVYLNLVNPITPSLWVEPRDRGNGPETRPGAKPLTRGHVAPNLPALKGRGFLLLGQGGQIEYL